MENPEFWDYLTKFDDWARAAKIVSDALDLAPAGTVVGPYEKTDRTLPWRMELGNGNRRGGMAETSSWGIAVGVCFRPSARNKPDQAREIVDKVHNILALHDALPEDFSPSSKPSCE